MVVEGPMAGFVIIEGITPCVLVKFQVAHTFSLPKSLLQFPVELNTAPSTSYAVVYFCCALFKCLLPSVATGDTFHLPVMKVVLIGSLLISMQNASGREALRKEVVALFASCQFIYLF